MKKSNGLILMVACESGNISREYTKLESGYGEFFARLKKDKDCFVPGE